MADCVVVALGGALATTVRRLWRDIDAGAGFRRSHPDAPPHVTMAVVEGPAPRGGLEAAVGRTAAGAVPFSVPGAGFGLFTGHDREDLVVHLALTTTPELAALHARLIAELAAGGLGVDGQSTEAFWRPHVNLADRGLTPRSAGSILSALAERGPRHWTAGIDNLALLGSAGALEGRWRLGV